MFRKPPGDNEKNIQIENSHIQNSQFGIGTFLFQIQFFLKHLFVFY